MKIKSNYSPSVNELLICIIRATKRMRNTVNVNESNFKANADHIENLAREALSYFEENDNGTK